MAKGSTAGATKAPSTLSSDQASQRSAETPTEKKQSENSSSRIESKPQLEKAFLLKAHGGRPIYVPLACLFLFAAFIYCFAPLMVLAGNLTARLGEPDRALLFFNTVLGEEPGNFDALAGRATANKLAGRYGQALADANNLVDLRPSSASAHMSRADLLSLLGRTGAAKPDLKFVQQHNPALALEYQRESYAAVYAQEDPAEIIRLASLALAVKPDLPKAYCNRAWGYLRRGQYEQAVQDATTGLSLEPSEKTTLSALYLVRGEAYCAMDQLTEAAADARASLAAEETTRAYRCLALYLTEAGQYRKLYDLAKACRLHFDPREIVVPFLLRQMYALTNDPRQELLPETGKFFLIKVSEYFLHRADMYLQGKNYKHALLACGFAARATPDKTTVLLARGRTYLGQGDFDLAVSDFSKCLTKRPGLAPAYYFRSLAEAALGQIEASAADAKKAAELGFSRPGEKYIHLMQDYLP